jgi:hypothetical protein
MTSLASNLDVPLNTISQEVRRKNGLFTKVVGSDGIDRVALISTQIQ